MKKLAILLLFFIFSISKAETVKFLQVTDVHFTKNNAKYLKEFVNDVNIDFCDLDFVVFTGDNLDKPNPDELWMFLDIIKKNKNKNLCYFRKS